MLHFVGVRSYWTLVSKGSTHVHPLSEGQETKKPRKKKVSAWEAANFIPSWGSSSFLVSLKYIHTYKYIMFVYIYIYICTYLENMLKKYPIFFLTATGKRCFSGFHSSWWTFFDVPTAGLFHQIREDVDSELPDFQDGLVRDLLADYGAPIGWDFHH